MWIIESCPMHRPMLTLCTVFFLAELILSVNDHTFIDIKIDIEGGGPEFHALTLFILMP